MSLAARCPWCETVFRLTEAQISVKGGMVRCGVCGHSFNAVDALLSDAAVAALEADRRAPTTPSDIPATPLPAAPEAAPEPQEASLDEFFSEQALAEVPRAPAETKPLAPSSPEPRAAEIAPARTLNDLRNAPIEIAERAPPPAADEEELLGPSTYHPSFMGPLDGPDVAPSRMRRAAAVILSVILAVGLLLQATYWWRDDLATALPEARPYLVLACQRLHCVIGPEAEIDQLSIESSELTAVPGLPGALNFSALLRNHRDVPLAYPAIEVTLTDARDQAVIRRVFLPRDYLRDDRRTHQNDGLASNSEFTVKIAFSTSGVATVGYRANLFYP